MYAHTDAYSHARMRAHTRACKYMGAQLVIMCERVLVDTWPMCSREHKRCACANKRVYLVTCAVLESAYLNASAMSCANASSKG